MAFVKPLMTAAAHFSLSALLGTQPVSSAAHVGGSVANLLASSHPWRPGPGLVAPSKHAPGPGGVCANAPPAHRKNMPLTANRRIPFMKPYSVGVGSAVRRCRYGTLLQWRESPKRTGTVKGKKESRRKKKWARHPPSNGGVANAPW